VYYTEWNKITRQAFTDGRRDQNKNFRWGTYVRKRLGSTQFGLEVVPDIRRLYLFIPFSPSCVRYAATGQVGLE